MDKPHLFFQYCPKFVLFSEDWASVFLARRKGEVDYDGTFGFIGGKMETTDADIQEGMYREKNEEIGSDAKVRLCLTFSYPILFRKKDGSSMIIPHHIAQFIGGEIKLNDDEYSEYRWVPLKDLESFEPKIENIPTVVDWALRIKPLLTDKDFVEV